METSIRSWTSSIIRDLIIKRTEHNISRKYWSSSKNLKINFRFNSEIHMMAIKRRLEAWQGNQWNLCKANLLNWFQNSPVQSLLQLKFQIQCKIKKYASSGSRTRVSCLEGNDLTVRPTMLWYYFVSAIRLILLLS